MKELIKVRYIMVLERLLLEIEENFKYEMNFQDAFKLHKLLELIGEITSYAFSLQNEYHKKYNDVDKLKKYHDMITDSELLLNYREIIKFIEYIKEKFNDEKFNRLVNEVNFWKGTF